MDKYDEAIRALHNSKDIKKSIRAAWDHPAVYHSGCLFQYVTPTGDLELFKDKHSRFRHRDCGCLTQVKRGDRPAYTMELTEAIMADERLPDCVEDITLELLPVFAEWQRKIDSSIRG